MLSSDHIEVFRRVQRLAIAVRDRAEFCAQSLVESHSPQQHIGRLRSAPGAVIERAQKASGAPPRCGGLPPCCTVRPLDELDGLTTDRLVRRIRSAAKAYAEATATYLEHGQLPD